jgi:hypothetical protein
VESNLSDNKNTIYAPTFLYAWEDVKQLFNSPIVTTGSNSTNFRLLNLSGSFKNSLNKGEYEANASLDDELIIAKAFFHKALPFSSKLQKINDGIVFGNEKVMAFGMNSPDDKIINFTKILFYKDDDNFIIKLIPEDTLHQIILVKGLQHIKTLANAINQTNTLIQYGSHEKLQPKNTWKYEFNTSDNFSIPVIRFNIEAAYKDLEGQTFSNKGKKYTIQIATQRTALTLDENGAVVESQAFAAADSVATPPKVHIKNMIFDKPFLIIIKQVDRTNPYFVMKIENDELLKKM